jgi:hypothetical protein
MNSRIRILATFITKDLGERGRGMSHLIAGEPVFCIIIRREREGRVQVNFQY